MHNEKGAGEVVLLPCPFCGGDASDTGHVSYSRPLADTSWEDGSPITETFHVNCIACGASSRSVIAGGFRTKADAIVSWNTRATRPPAPEDAGTVERGRSALEWMAGQKTVEEVMNTEYPTEWSNASPEQRIAYMAERKQAHDTAVIDARAALAALSRLDGEG